MLKDHRESERVVPPTTMIPLARPLGPLLNALPRLQAYTIDIVGSMAGTATFFVIAWFSAPPIVWFGGLVLLLVSLSGPKTLLLGALPVIVTLAIVLFGYGGWSVSVQTVSTDLAPSHSVATLHGIAGCAGSAGAACGGV